MTIRIILADGYKLLLDALKTFLEKEKDIKVVGVANDTSVVQELVALLQPDVVVMDIGTPGINGIEVTRRLVAEYPKVKVIVLSDFAHKQHVLEMLEAGAIAYVVKENAGSELVHALHAVMKGKKYLCPEIAAVVENTGHYYMVGVRELGPREREVLQLVAEGHTSQIIAKRLFISPATVDVHRRNIMGKLDLHNVAELTKYAVRNGLTSV